ncbi:MAG: flagellar hook-basal body complex protein [Candidatus Eisenbacteria bacterium]|nr:flagellar hook-basal body complex protein [Candidatus Eisenbacteria bacterium]
MSGFFWSAVTGVKGHLFSMSVIGNNVANVNTNAFKSSRTTFQEALVQTQRPASAARGNYGGSNAMQVGLGMEVASIDSIREQGMLRSTGNVTDLAIDGEGYFVLSDGESQYFTRAGNFSFDADGYLTASGSGLKVQGWLANESGQIPTGAPLENMRLPFGEKTHARSTTEVKFECNLDALASNSLAELDDAGTTGITSVSGTAVNGAGGSHAITFTGANATASTAAGTAGLALTGTEELGALGVTDASSFELTIDGSDSFQILGLTTDSTVNDLIAAINNSGAGVTAELDTGEVRLTRVYHGIGTLYNIESNTAVAGDIANIVLGVAAGSTFTANSGTNSTLEATDVFTPTDHAAMTASSLALTYDEETGLATGISNLAGGGVTISAEDGFAAGTATIDTAATEHLTSILVYDTLGMEHTLNMTFTRSAMENTWYWDASFDGNETVSAGSTGMVQFNSDGSYRNMTFDDDTGYLRLEPGTGAEGIQIEFWAGTANRLDGITQFSSPFTTKASGQDGYGMGNLNTISIDASGKITGLFTNGTLRDMGQVVLAKFNNPDGLNRVGGSLYQVSPNSGHIITGAAGTTIGASINSKSLEMSNVDLSEEFVQMITAQRGFQANSRVITSGDEILQELINIKR